MTSYEVLYAETAEKVQEEMSGEGTDYHMFQPDENECPPPLPPSRSVSVPLRESVFIGETPQKRTPRLKMKKEPSFSVAQLPKSVVQSIRSSINMTAHEQIIEEGEVT
eukprot:CAMPEP_0183314994 /NCGR_PEP_ID=MMETSP0160_2-20130417/50320_1 /TAXON_ID=2839 ORGANISM="Odontella Sinensis, Strain Grunow 1884" /NCGR_SAMPLE_ID=MMETSP0160_2 /ASSEMBLY_ACC=CAM_ASM_000250 /LENGTH=107 /DNA_ID=CAMNT_0025480455 /DNA_START=38 /DNA_END=358 /DNA_ORIENTATION=+